MKLLGFVFGEKPTVHAQVNNIIEKAASRSFVIRHLAGVGVDKGRIKNIYCSIIRSLLEYSSVTFGPMLAQYQVNRLENIQKMPQINIWQPIIKYRTVVHVRTGNIRREKREGNIEVCSKSCFKPSVQSLVSD